MVFRNGDLRHVDVAILYGLGQTDRAQLIARRLRPSKVRLESVNLSTTTGDRSTGTYLDIGGDA